MADMGNRMLELLSTSPPPGGAAASPVRIGGKITGVDENLRAEVHQL
jgi:hypothetical protein